MKGINYKDNRRTEGAKGRKGCFPQITKLLPPRAGGQESTFDAELLEGGVAPSAATVGTVLMHWVVSQEPTLLIFLRLGDLMPQLPAVILRSPLLLLPMLEIEKKNKTKLLLLSTVKSLTSPSVWQTNLLKYSIAPGSEWLKKWDVSKEDIYVLL